MRLAIKLLSSRNRVCNRLNNERGNAPVEFIGWATVIAVPLAYFLLALSAVQAASFGAESAVEAAARILSVDSGQQAQQHANLAAELALQDQGIDRETAQQALTIQCRQAGCHAGELDLRVEVTVKLPLIGQMGSSRLVTVDAVRTVAGAAGQ